MNVFFALVVPFFDRIVPVTVASLQAFPGSLRMLLRCKICAFGITLIHPGMAAECTAGDIVTINNIKRIERY